MRVIVALSLLILGCAHAPSNEPAVQAHATDPRCAAVTSPRDLAFIRAKERATYEQAAEDIRRIADNVDRAATQGLNARNQSSRPLTAEETLAAGGRVNGMLKILKGEQEHMRSLAAALPDTPLGTVPAADTGEPGRSTLQDICRKDLARLDGEMSQTRHVVEGELGEFQAWATDYGLRVGVTMPTASK